MNLGVDYRRTLLTTLAAIAALVSVSTALVGPVTFFGLLVSNLAYQLMGSDRHRHALPAAMLLAVCSWWADRRCWNACCAEHHRERGD